MDLTGTRTPYTDLKVIERDQAIAMRVVAASNAAYYGFSGKIRTISQAILILGFDLVRGLAITTTVFNSMPAKEKDRLLELWAHSFETAQAAALIAQRTGAIEKESAFLAGLFHDIGRPVLLQTCETETGISPFDRNTLEEEEEAFGANHAEAGSWFAGVQAPGRQHARHTHHHNPEACAKPSKLPTWSRYLPRNRIVAGRTRLRNPPPRGHIASLKLTREDLL